MNSQGGSLETEANANIFKTSNDRELDEDQSEFIWNILHKTPGTLNIPKTAKNNVTRIHTINGTGRNRELAKE